MKKLIILTVLLLSSVALSAQEFPPVKILLTQSLSDVQSYYDGLKATYFKDNKYVKTVQSVNTNGDVTLTFETPTREEYKTNSLSILTVFARHNGKDICTRQAILGTNVSVVKNMNFVKDNFKKLSETTWIMSAKTSNGSLISGLDFIAELDKDSTNYMIIYDIVDKK